MSVSGIPGLGKATNSWTTIFAPWNVAGDVMTAYQAPKVAKAQGEVALAEQAAARDEAARVEREQALLQDALAQLQASRNSLARRWRGAVDAFGSVQGTYASAAAEGIELDPALGQDAAQWKRGGEEILVQAATGGEPATAEVARSLKQQVDSYWSTLDAAATRVEQDAAAARDALARARVARAAADEARAREEQTRRMAAFSNLGRPASGAPSFQAAAAPAPGRGGLMSLFFGNAFGLSGVPGMGALGASSELALALAAADRVHRDVESGRSLEQVQRDLNAAQGFLANVPDDEYAQASAAVQSAQRDYNSYASMQDRASAASSGFDAATSVPTGQAIDTGSGSSLWDTWAGSVNDATLGYAHGGGEYDAKGALGTRFVPVLGSEGRSAGDLLKQGCASLPAPLGWACANPGKAVGVGVGVLAVLYLGPTLLGRSKAFWKAARS